jgi:iron(III) transport system ATP-binding protein
MRVSIRNLSKRFGGTTALRDVSLEVRSQELFFLLGPSGCGKTTLLRVIAGFYQAEEGELFFGEKPLNDVPPHRRNAGMVFQNYALWPHLSVAENVAYGLEVRGVSSSEKKARIAEALSIVQMESFASHSPNQLSGGQQQRVALARALVIRPDLLLLDEPLSNLDAKLRLELREEIRRIHARTKLTTIYVTHDQKEALSLADRIAVMRDGVIEQTADPRTLYRAPATRFVADFIGATNWLRAQVQAVLPGEVVLDTEIGPLKAATTISFNNGETVWLGFRPESVQIGASKGVNCFSTTVAQISYLGDVEQYALDVGQGRVIKALEQNPRAVRRKGASLFIHVRPEDCLVLRTEEK